MTWWTFLTGYLILLAVWLLVRLILGKPVENKFDHDLWTCNCSSCVRLRRVLNRKALERQLRNRSRS